MPVVWATLLLSDLRRLLLLSLGLTFLFFCCTQKATCQDFVIVFRKFPVFFSFFHFSVLITEMLEGWREESVNGSEDNNDDDRTQQRQFNSHFSRTAQKLQTLKSYPVRETTGAQSDLR